MDVAGILLGGGRSRRFGSPKLEARLSGERLLDLACAHFLEAGLRPVVFAGRGRPADPRVVVAPPGDSMIATLRNALAAIPEGPFAFAPADMPALDPELIRRLAAEFERCGKPFLIPCFRGRRGHPAFAATRAPFLVLGDADGPREVWRAHAADVAHVEVGEAGILRDVDTPEDLASFVIQPSPMNPALRYLEDNKDRFLELLFDFLRIPSISAVKARHGDARRAAEFVRERLEAAGFTAGLFESEGLPTVHGARIEGPDKPTLLMYGHYDVQPPEPLDLWETPPFEPTLVGDEVRARGCADDKGPTLALLLAVECLAKTGAPLPVNLRVVIEGEEECGGHVVEDYLEQHRAELAAEAVVIADTSGFAAGVPALCYGLRGLAALEVQVTGPARDLHSGTYGGTLANPVTALARLIATLHDEDGRVAIEGFYDGILPVDDAERARCAALPFDEKAYLVETGAPALFGEKGYTTLERKGARPTCEINGIAGGYAGEGIKTIVPSTANCKLTCRLVPGQDPAAIQQAVRRHLERHCPPGVKLEVRDAHRAPAVYTDPETPWAKAARAALREAFGVEPALTREGGSIPVVNVFSSLLGVQPLLLGTYAPGERAHSPNERYRVDDYLAAIKAGIALFSP